MISKPSAIVVASLCIFACSAVSSYIFKHTLVSDSDSGSDIKVLEDELHALQEQIKVLEDAEALMPVEKNWLIAQKITERYPKLIWRASADLEIANEAENAWGAVMIASPDLLLPVVRLIQNKVPAEVSEIQLDQRQGVLLINILGMIK